MGEPRKSSKMKVLLICLLAIQLSSAADSESDRENHLQSSGVRQKLAPNELPARIARASQARSKKKKSTGKKNLRSKQKKRELSKRGKKKISKGTKKSKKDKKGNITKKGKNKMKKSQN